MTKKEFIKELISKYPDKTTRQLFEVAEKEDRYLWSKTYKTFKNDVGSVRTELGINFNYLQPQTEGKPKDYVEGKPLIEGRFGEISLYNGKKTKRYVITTAINDTPVHNGFYESLRHYIDTTQSELVVYAGKYRNPTSPYEHFKNNPQWDKRIEPFLTEESLRFNDSVVFLKANAIPTRQYPLNGLENHTGRSSLIIPHPKQHFKSLPTYKNDPNKIAISTGAITVPNYSKSDTGMKGNFHHIIGATVLEIEDNRHFHVRHISAEKDGSFYDLLGGKLMHFSGKGVEDRSKKEKVNFVWGDIHYTHHDEECIKAAVKVAKELDTENIILHDIYDAYSNAKHDYQNPFEMYKREMKGLSSVKNEVQGLAKWLKGVHKELPNTKFRVAKSNHDQHLDQWLLYETPKTMKGDNVPYWHYLNHEKYRSFDGKNFHDTLKFALNDFIDTEECNVSFFSIDDSFRIHEIELAQHGHLGANGSRGSTQGFSKLSTKTIHGHTHTSICLGGATSVGVFCNNPDYAKGPSSWIKNMAILYPSGKRCLLNFVNGKFFKKF